MRAANLPRSCGPENQLLDPYINLMAEARVPRSWPPAALTQLFLRLDPPRRRMYASCMLVMVHTRGYIIARGREENLQGTIHRRCHIQRRVAARTGFLRARRPRNVARNVDFSTGQTDPRPSRSHSSHMLPSSFLHRVPTRMTALPLPR